MADQARARGTSSSVPPSHPSEDSSEGKSHSTSYRCRSGLMLSLAANGSPGGRARHPPAECTTVHPSRSKCGIRAKADLV